MPDVVTEAGLKATRQVLLGRPLTLNVTTPLNPPDGVTVTVNVAALPRLTLELPGEAVIVNEPDDALFTTCVTVFEPMPL